MVSFMPKDKSVIVISVFLAAATLTAFWQVTQCDFVYFDDPRYVTENSQVQQGITLEGIRWAFTTFHFANWHPLTWISHLSDVQLFGLRPRWHHLTNLLFHIANTVLLFFVLLWMTKVRWESAVVAALFALHPLHVESVAWVSERKDVLSTFFWLLTMGAYCRYVERPGLRRYLLVVLFFAMGLMSKPMLVTLPFVLLLLDYWPLQRFQQSDQMIRTEIKNRGHPQTGVSWKEEAAYRWRALRPLLWEKLPIFALTLLSSIVTLIAQQRGGAVVPVEAYTIEDRISNAVVSYLVYIGKTIWPSDLAVSYPYRQSLPAWQVIGAALLMTTITVTVIRKAKRAPYLATGWLWYAGTLVPVIGIVQVGIQARADRYTYVPLIGLFIMAAWGISELSRNWRYRKEAVVASSAAVVVCLSLVTRTQVGYWHNSFVLFEHALKVTEKNYTIYYNEGTAYLYSGNYLKAIGDYDKAIEINPSYARAYNNRGVAHSELGNDRQAIGDFARAIEILPRFAEAYYNLGATYLQMDDFRQAEENYSKAIEINPQYAAAYYNRAYAYSRLGNDRKSIEDLKTAARLGYQHAQNTLKRQYRGW
jgi:hypothetical protein